MNLFILGFCASMLVGYLWYIFDGNKIKMRKLGDKIRLGIMCGFLALVAYVWIEAIVLIQMAYSG